MMLDKSAAIIGTIRIFLIDANPLVISAIVEVITAQPDLAIARTSDRGDDLLKAEETAFDLAVLAWDLADVKAPEILRKLKANGSTVKTVIFSNNRDPSALRQAVRLGARGFCFQHEPAGILVNTVRAVAAGHFCIPYIDIGEINDSPLSSLTVRERELLEVLARGWTNQQIANRTGISENTVKYHLKNLYEKLGARSRSMAVAVWLRESEA
ncbi:response regulator transcription factor (plasmid) [Mesorhizobium sp. WSM2240]|uniref:Response regulator transcription factor n=3 Tax=Mesorhizobium TaxID=68287 RepID=A0AAU8DIG2_9HYPH